MTLTDFNCAFSPCVPITFRRLGTSSHSQGKGTSYQWWVPLPILLLTRLLPLDWPLQGLPLVSIRQRVSLARQLLVPFELAVAASCCNMRTCPCQPPSVPILPWLRERWQSAS